MRTRTFFSLLIVGLAIVLVLSSTTVQAKRPPITDETAVWELKHTKVVDPGRTEVIPANPETGFPGGTLTTGFTIEAQARSKSGHLVQNGAFRMTLSAFWPNADMPAQKAGAWYIEGMWSIVSDTADKPSLNVRHNPFTVEGRVHTALPFNPALDPNNMTLEASLPMSLAAGQWARGNQGVLTLSSGLEGEIQLPIKLWTK
jgi:hypothetical protein